MDARKLVLGLVTLAVLAAPAAATPLPRYGTFIYSSLCRNRMTNDINGDQLVLVRLPLHDVGYMEWGDGGFSSTPLENLKIKDGSGKITFQYRDLDDKNPNAMKNVSSTINAQGVSLASWNGKSFRLPRLRKIIGKLPTCH